VSTISFASPRDSSSRRCTRCLMPSVFTG
jgi:hypothetical protein